jgi:O-antigen/teichoic acid export membrane protein
MPTAAKKPAAKHATAPNPNKSDNALAIISMVLGASSLMGPGLLFGIPAIVLATIALKKDQGERALSITGLVTGIISTVLSLLLIIGIVLLFIWEANHPETMAPPRPAHIEQVPHSSI